MNERNSILYWKGVIEDWQTEDGYSERMKEANRRCVRDITKLKSEVKTLREENRRMKNALSMIYGLSESFIKCT